MSYRSAFVLAAGTTAATASFLLAPGAQAVGVSATPGLTYSVHGSNVNYVASLTGTQHTGTMGHTTVAQPGVMSYDLDFGDGSGTAGDAGMAQCSTEGVAPLAYSMPTTHRYAKPGTYTVKVKFTYCGDAANSKVSRTERVVVGSTAPTTTTPAAHAPVGTAPVKPAPNSSVKAPATAGAVEGPKVQTDGVRGTSGSRDLEGAALGLGAAGLALMGALYVRKGRTN